MFDFLRTTFTSTEQKDIDQEKFVEETMKFHGQKATKFNANYQNERQWKANYILVNVVAEGYDIKRFLERLVEAKSKILFVIFRRLYT